MTRIREQHFEEVPAHIFMIGDYLPPVNIDYRGSSGTMLVSMELRLLSNAPCSSTATFQYHSPRHTVNTAMQTDHN